ncbi:transglutaminase domain-containing protein, partial [Actinoplanes sp. NPDC051633]
RLSLGTPDARISGAGLEFTAARRLAGMPVPPHLAATEAAAHGASVPRPAAPRLLRRATPAGASTDVLERPVVDGLPPLDRLVDGVNTTAFALGAAGEEQARRAGDEVVAYASALRARRSWWRRAWWSLHPGPLRWHRRR